MATLISANVQEQASKIYSHNLEPNIMNANYSGICARARRTDETEEEEKNERSKQINKAQIQ